MTHLWNEFCKVEDIDQGTVMFDGREQCEAWMDYVMKHYTETLPVASTKPGFEWLDR